MATDEASAGVSKPESVPAVSSADAEALAEVRRLNQEVVRLCAEHAEQTNRAKSVKKLLEAARRHFRDYLAGMEKEYPLFDRPVPAPAMDDAWRAVPVDVLCTDHGLSRGVVAKLVEFGLHTLGALADWTDGGHALTDIPGIGDASAEKVGTALVDFWEAEARRQAQGATDDPLSCPKCGGSGGGDDPVLRCTTCDGTGRLTSLDASDRRPVRGGANGEITAWIERREAEAKDVLGRVEDRAAFEHMKKEATGA